VTAATWPAVAGPFSAEDFQSLIPVDKKLDPAWVKSLAARGEPTVYRGAELDKIGMPIGGLCTGQLYLGGDGRLWHWDLFNLPQPSNFRDTSGPNYARPPSPYSPIEQGFGIRVTSGVGSPVRTLDRRGFAAEHIRFRGEYPMAHVEYADPAFPVSVSLEAFSPFLPLSMADSSLPATVMRFTVKNTSAAPVEVVVAGWFENAVCRGMGPSPLARHRNRVIRESGMTFVQCTAERPPSDQVPAPRSEIVYETFENGYGAWEKTGDAFGAEPAPGTLASQNPVTGFAGKRLVNTFLEGDGTRGQLISPWFTIERRFIAFLMGGGAHAGRTCMNLLVHGQVVRTATGRNEERLDWQEWDVSEFEGKRARLQIVDEATEGWGHINVDQIVFTDAPPSSRVPLEEREDYGSMGLAVMGGDAAAFGRSHVGTREEIFYGRPPEGPVEDAVRRLGERPIGAVGRRLSLAPGAEGDVVFVVAWYFPGMMRGALGPLQDVKTLKRSYAKRFGSAAEVARHVTGQFERLAGGTRLWNRTWYDSTLPYWFLDRTFAPICTLATSTCFQFDNGRFYAFEGVYCCQGTCQHVWNYAQSVARIFPELERDLRVRTDFGTSWHEDGATDYRGECARHVAHDGQCGVILRVWREHQMSPDDGMLRSIWPRVRRSIEYLITLDGGEDGLLEGEQYNTLDAAWFGPMAWISSFYLAALRAGEAMAEEMGDRVFAERCGRIAERGARALVRELYNGEYFIHKPDPAHPNATNTNDGCHIDQLMGQAWALQVGLPRVVGAAETRSALDAVWKYNFTPDVGPFRDGSRIKGGRWYAMAGEGGVVMTTFPRGGVERAAGQGGFGFYFNEVWTGQEHQLAAHMMAEGMVDRALVITRVIHDRHHAARRNPYNEVECSDHYTRAMSSHGTFLAACGYEHHGPKGHLGFAPRLSPERFKAPFTAAEGWGQFEQVRTASGQVETLRIRYGRLRLRTLAFAVAEGSEPREARVRLNGAPVAASMSATGSRVLVALGEMVTIPEGATLEVTLA